MTAKSDSETVEARQAQSAASKKNMFNILRNKKPASKSVTITINDEDGSEQELELKFVAISHVEYDRLQSKCPPTTEQRAQGEPFNIKEFAPTLLSRVVAEPDMSVDEWKEIWSSPAWSRGECAQLFAEAVNICTRGLDIPFNVND